jgi:hypothetical protein
VLALTLVLLFAAASSAAPDRATGTLQLDATFRQFWRVATDSSANAAKATFTVTVK